jgi:hypothetical protein
MSRNPVVAIVLAVVLAACGASVQPTVSPSPSPQPSGPSPSPRPSTAPTEGPSRAPSEVPAPVGFELGEVPPSRKGSAITAMVETEAGLVAIGFDGGYGSVLWTSDDDGATWTDVTPPDFASRGLVSVVGWDGGLVAVGRGNTIDVDTEEAAVFRSEDGLTWRQVPTSEEMVGQMIDVVATDDALVAVGGVPGADAAGVWRSSDGETWTRIGGEFPQTFFWAIAEGGPGLVTVGWIRDDTGAPNLAVWTSADGGATWDRAPDPEGSDGQEATDVAVLADGSLAMVGSSLHGGMGRVWHSTDGVAWDLVQELGDPLHARSLVPTPAGLLALGGGDDMGGRAWVSADGRAWQPLGDPIEGAYLAAALPLADGLLVAGATQSGTLETGIDAYAAIWRATLDD